MKHLGDITKLNGAEIPVVDCITGGSPCQDLSVAGKRAGLDGERSGLFMEQVRIVKEMRAKEMENGRTAESVRPRWMVWENVPGAFSSNGGKDFQAVLTEIVRIVEQECPDVPLPDKGKWPKYGAICDEMGGWSVAWRTHDAQYLGVPQRRRRICVVADFNGATAADVLFDPQLRRETENQESDKAIRNSGRKPRRKIQVERESLFGNTESSGEEGEETAEGIGKCADLAISIQGNTIDRDAKQNGIGISENIAHTLNSVDRHGVMCLNDQGGSVMDVSDNVTGTLRAQDHGHQPLVYGIDLYNQCITGGVAKTLNSIRDDADHVPCVHVYDARGNGAGAISPTITGDHENRITDYTAIVAGYKSFGDYEITETGKSLLESDDVTTGDLIINNRKNIGIVRRLTPLECERLQGFPDGWTDIGEWTDTKGKKHKEADSPRYKALGNSIALPFWFYLLRRISATYERPATLGSLFDGIGGFPLCWERCNGKGTAIWASEIEEFPIAVTKIRFPE